MPTAPLPRPQKSAASGTTLLLCFTLALLVGIVPILMIGVYGTWISVAVAVASIIGLAFGVIAFLTRYLGD